MERREIAKAIIKSIVTKSWLALEYTNNKGEDTSYWGYVIGIEGKLLRCLVFHKSGKRELEERCVKPESIRECHVLEGTYHEGDDSLLEEIRRNPFMADWFSIQGEGGHESDILDYLYECHLFDCPAYKSSYLMLKGIDDEVLCDSNSGYPLNDEQFMLLINKLSKKSDPKKRTATFFEKELAMNVVSIASEGHLYVLAYRSLLLDVENRRLFPSQEISINYEFQLKEKEVESIRSIEKYLSEEDLPLLLDFQRNAEEIKEVLAKNNPRGKVDDLPHIYNLQRNLMFDLKGQYGDILSFLSKNPEFLPESLKVFFYKSLPENRSHPRKPIVLYDQRRINLDQLLVINKSIKKDLTYVQGPPGTGKTNTILSVILTAFYNGEKVLLTSQNNHPMDAVYEALKEISLGTGKSSPLPILRLGNRENVLEAMSSIREILIGIIRQSADKKMSRAIKKCEQRSSELASFMDKYEKKLLIEEKEAAIGDFVDSNNLALADLFAQQSIVLAKEKKKLGPLSEEQALEYIRQDDGAMLETLYQKSRSCLIKLKNPKYKPLLEILDMKEGTPQEKDGKIKAFNSYLRDSRNLSYFLEVFPIIVTTNSSAGKLGGAFPHFDLCIIDEAGQCPVATSILAFARAKRLLLVGDINQLSPVIILDPRKNELLREKYHVGQAYDYISNSIYSCFSKLDPLSDEILLSYHYRSDPRIIGFNNRKFYNGKLKIRSNLSQGQALVYVDVPNSKSEGKNTSLSEISHMAEYIKSHPEEDIAVITPFVPQKELISAALRERGIGDVEVGTVHSFQGDEKDTILFSSAVTEKTHGYTYAWLKENRELINVATSRAKKKLILYGDRSAIRKLHGAVEGKDDFYELCSYVFSKGKSEVSSSYDGSSRALTGYKTYTTETEAEFLENLAQAMSVLSNSKRFLVHHNVSIKDLFEKYEEDGSLFFTGHFDFVIYARSFLGDSEIPLMAFEVDGDEHYSDPRTIERDKKKNEIARAHHLELIRVKNSYSRRYNLIKGILVSYLRAKEYKAH